MIDYPAGIRSRIIKDINGLSMHILEAGYDDNANKPCIVLLHGFPELAYSWRKIFKPLSDAGYYVIAPDQRGYGYTEGWNNNYEGDISEYEISNLITDIISLIYSLEKKSIDCLVGHDFGSIVAAHAAVIRPDIFKSVVLMSAPFNGMPSIEPSNIAVQSNINTDLQQLDRPRKHYQWYYSTKEANDDMCKSDQGMKNFLRAYYHVKSGDWKDNNPFKLKAWNASELEKMPGYYIMDFHLGMAEQVNIDMPSTGEIDKCKWLTDKELQYYVDVFNNTQFQGGLNWYRCMIDNTIQSKLRIFSNIKINIPSIFIAGRKDWGIYQKPNALENMQLKICTNMESCELIEGAGHWVQQERPEEVSKLLLNFLSKL